MSLERTSTRMEERAAKKYEAKAYYLGLVVYEKDVETTSSAGFVCNAQEASKWPWKCNRA